jgi:sugar O-acyltransferase (sialic acid O-acetyltransferase NeuD family)
VALSRDWLLGLVGAGGFGREVMPLAVKAALEMSSVGVGESVCFVETSPSKSVVNGIACLSEEEFLQHPSDVKKFNVAVADAATRQSIVSRFVGAGAEPFSIVAKSAEVGPGVEIGPGAILCGFTSVTANAVIGKFFHANIYSYVAHDCVIGDYVTFAPNVHCNGNVHIEDHAYIGSGAVLKQGSVNDPLVIGRGAVVGMGAIVTRSVAPGATVVGNPARTRP